MAAAQVIKFPTARVVRRRTFMHHLEDTGTSEARIAIEWEIFSVQHALDALRRQHKSLITQLRWCIHREGGALMGKIEVPRDEPGEGGQINDAAMALAEWAAAMVVKNAGARPVAAVAESGGLDALLLRWLALRESCEGKSNDKSGDEEVARISDEMGHIERQILAGAPATESDWRALVAMAVIRAREAVPYANVGVIEDLYRRFVIDRVTDPVGRSRERGYSRRRVADAKAHLAELQG